MAAAQAASFEKLKNDLIDALSERVSTVGHALQEEGEPAAEPATGLLAWIKSAQELSLQLAEANEVDQPRLISALEALLTDLRRA